jgi:N6-adenosine-specific RNA methylase IME4
MKYNLIIIDASWSFSDKLKQSNVKRGAADHYDLMSNKDIINLDVKSIAADDAVLALWVPCSLLQEGLDAMKSYGFKQKQMVVWVKTKKAAKELDNCLSFGMGNIYRQTHEIALIGTRGKVSKYIKNRSQRSVFFGLNEKHSKKPESLHESLELIFPEFTDKAIELFARRNRPGWICVGNQCDGEFFGKDLGDVIEELKTR